MLFYSILTIKNILFWKLKKRSGYSISQSKFWGDVEKETADIEKLQLLINIKDKQSYNLL